MRKTEQRDLIIIGGGLAGIVCLYYAKRAGLDSLLLERQSTVGGLWAGLPTWQDIQQSRNDWTMKGFPIDGEDQASIQKNIQSWVDKYDLASSIRLNTEVTSARRVDQCWKLATGDRRYICTDLVAATGAHNTPVIPNPSRLNSTIKEFHSSQLREPECLRNKRVLVVGGGASAFDLLDLSFAHHAKKIDWVYRSVRWMAPTKKPKRIAGDVRWIGQAQMRGETIEQLSHRMNAQLRSRYEGFGLSEIEPEEDFDFRKHQPIPGRCGMIQNFDRIKKHRGEVCSIVDDTVTLSTKDELPVDIILWGTGYTIDLRFFDQSPLASLTNPADVVARCGSKLLSLDESNLFFIAPGIVGGFGCLSWQYAHAAIAIVSHIQKISELSTEPITQNLDYFDHIQFLASMDRANYPSEVWPRQYEVIAEALSDGDPLPMPTIGNALSEVTR